MVEQRSVRIYCSCKGPTQQPANSWDDLATKSDIFRRCPIHGLPRLSFPVDPRAVGAALRKIGMTRHCMRRGLSLALRASINLNIDFKISAWTERMGRSSSASMRSKYTEDFKIEVHTAEKFPHISR